MVLEATCSIEVLGKLAAGRGKTSQKDNYDRVGRGIRNPLAYLYGLQRRRRLTGVVRARVYPLYPFFAKSNVSQFSSPRCKGPEVCSWVREKYSYHFSKAGLKTDISDTLI